MGTRTTPILAAGAVAIATSVVLASCGAFSGSSDNNPADAAQSPAKDAGSPIDATLPVSTIDGAPCSSFSQTGSICDSFDLSGSGYGGFWSTVDSAGGTLFLSTHMNLSPPTSLWATVPDVPDSSMSRFQDLVTTIDFHSHVYIDVDFYVVLEGAVTGAYAEIVDLAFDGKTIETARVAIGEDDVQAYINTYSGDAVAGKTTSGSANATTVNYHDQWHHAHVELVFDTVSGGSAFTISSAAGIKAFPPTTGNDTRPATTPKTLTVSIGDSPGAGASTVYLDNFVLSTGDN